jgi:4-amino-4-deoxy-L-arabinose transferase-like glycosyltransferase
VLIDKREISPVQRAKGQNESAQGWRRNSLVLSAIILLALILRVIYQLQARGHLFFNDFTDFPYYHRWALSIVQGQPGPPVFAMAPLYPYLLALIYSVFGPRPEVVLWFQVLLGLASCGLLYLLGRMLFGRDVGLLAALMGALYVVEIFYEGVLLASVALYAINLLLLISICWARRRNKWFFWFVPGLLLGVSALGRANILVFLPFLILGILLLSGTGGKKAVRRAPATLATLLGLSIAIAPVTIHNRTAGDDLVLLTSNFGLNFFVGNNPDARGYYEEPKGLDLDGGDFLGFEIAEFLSGTRLKPSQVSRFWLERSLDFVKEQPRAFMRLTVDKLLLFWNAYEIPQAEHMDFSKGFIPLLKWPLLRFSILGPLGLLGMALSLRRWRDSYFLLTFVFSLMVGTVLFFVLARLRLQVCAVLMIFAAYAMVCFKDMLRARKVRQFALTVLALVPLALLVNWPQAALSSARDTAKSHNIRALYLLNRGDLAGASWQCERALSLDSLWAPTYLCLANVRLAQGRADEVWNLHEKALLADSQVSVAHLNLGRLYAREGMWDRAIAEFRAEIKSSPYNVAAYRALSGALAEAERERMRSSSESQSDSGRPK